MENGCKILPFASISTWWSDMGISEERQQSRRTCKKASLRQVLEVSAAPEPSGLDHCCGWPSLALIQQGGCEDLA